MNRNVPNAGNVGYGLYSARNFIEESIEHLSRQVNEYLSLGSVRNGVKKKGTSFSVNHNKYGKEKTLHGQRPDPNKYKGLLTISRINL
jgi:hypothetical protein